MCQGAKLDSEIELKLCNVMQRFNTKLNDLIYLMSAYFYSYKLSVVNGKLRTLTKH